MDELDAIRALHEAISAPDMATVSRVRARALALIDELEASAAVGEPRGSVRDPSAVGAMSAPVTARPADSTIDLTLTEPVGMSGSGLRPPRSKAPLAAVALVALILVTVVAAFSADPSQELQSGLPERSAQELVRLAGLHPDRPLGPGELLYTRVLAANADDGGAVEVRDVWITPDGESYDYYRMIDSPQAPLPPVPVDPVGPLLPNRGAFAGLSYDEVRTMPTTPTAIEEHLERFHRLAPGTENAALVVANLAALTVAPPDVRAAAVEILLRWGQPVGEATDPLGRPGLLLLGGDPDAVPVPRGWAVVIDQTTGLPLAVAIRVPGPADFAWQRTVGWLAFGPQEVRSA
ncbi:MAG: hypothetical protein WHS89_11375 [Acidimicrobiales bacterium]